MVLKQRAPQNKDRQPVNLILVPTNFSPGTEPTNSRPTYRDGNAWPDGIGARPPWQRCGNVVRYSRVPVLTVRQREPS